MKSINISNSFPKIFGKIASLRHKWTRFLDEEEEGMDWAFQAVKGCMLGLMIMAAILLFVIAFVIPIYGIYVKATGQ